MVIKDLNQLAKLAGKRIVSVTIETDAEDDLIPRDMPTGIRIIVRDSDGEKNYSSIVIHPDIAGYDETFHTPQQTFEVCEYAVSIPERIPID